MTTKENSMSVTIENKYNNYYNVSKDLVKALDTNNKVWQRDAIEAAKKYVDCFDKNPTRAQMMLNYAMKKNLSNPYVYDSKLGKLLDIETIDNHIQPVLYRYNKKYPKTGKIRKNLIEADRILPDVIKPKIKSSFKKLCLKLI